MDKKQRKMTEKKKIFTREELLNNPILMSWIFNNRWDLLGINVKECTGKTIGLETEWPGEITIYYR